MVTSRENPSYEKTVCPHCGKGVYVRYLREPQLRILGLVGMDGVITETKSNPDIDVIYDFWNSQHIIVHRNMTRDIAKAIRSELKNYSEVEIMQAIKNYAEIQKGDQYWFKYAWTLRDFMKRGIAKFLDLEIAKRNYLNRDNQKGTRHPIKIDHMHCISCKLEDVSWKLVQCRGVCPKCGGKLLWGTREQAT